MLNYIIVDANIARSCTDPARHETSEACLLLTFLLLESRTKVGAVTTPKLIEEWNKHASKTFISWWAKMESRNRILAQKDTLVKDYRKAISQVEDSGIKVALDKDVHIVELALLKHYPIASQDERQRRYVYGLAENYELLKKIRWFNPTIEKGWDAWIRSGMIDSQANLLSVPVAEGDS